MEEQTNIVSYKCPNCAAPLVYEIESQMWECHFCDSTFNKQQLENFAKSQGSEQPEQSEWTAEVFDDSQMTAFVCPDCGGRVISDKNTVSTFCTFCHNPTVLSAKLQGEFKPALILPFKVSKDQAMASLRKLVKGKPLLPKRFKEIVENGEITGLYAPFWLFSSDVWGNLNAEGKRVTTWADSKYIYTKTDTYLVTRNGKIAIKMVPVDASQRLDDKLMDSIEPFNFSDLDSFRMEYLSGYFAENFDVDAKLSFQRFSKRAADAARTALHNTIGHYDMLTISNFSTNFTNSENFYVMLPVWTVSVKYKDKIYAFAMNGQTGKSAGKLPVSVQRLLAFFFGIGAGLTAIIYFVGKLLGRL